MSLKKIFCKILSYLLPPSQDRIVFLGYFLTSRIDFGIYQAESASVESARTITRKCRIPLEMGPPATLQIWYVAEFLIIDR